MQPVRLILKYIKYATGISNNWCFPRKTVLHSTFSDRPWTEHNYFLSIHLNKKLHIIKHKINVLMTYLNLSEMFLPCILYCILYSFGNWLTPLQKGNLSSPPTLKEKKKNPLDCPETGKIIQINFPFCLFVQFKMIKFTSHFKTLQGHFASSESSSTWTTLRLSNV